KNGSASSCVQRETSWKTSYCEFDSKRELSKRKFSQWLSLAQKMTQTHRILGFTIYYRSPRSSSDVLHRCSWWAAPTLQSRAAPPPGTLIPVFLAHLQQRPLARVEQVYPWGRLRLLHR